MYRQPPSFPRLGRRGQPGEIRNHKVQRTTYIVRFGGERDHNPRALLVHPATAHSQRRDRHLSAAPPKSPGPSSMHYGRGLAVCRCRLTPRSLKFLECLETVRMESERPFIGLVSQVHQKGRCRDVTFATVTRAKMAVSWQQLPGCPNTFSLLEHCRCPNLAASICPRNAMI